jgi:hypothetical protein
MPQMNAGHYRNQAEDCRVKATMSFSQLDKDAWLVLAADWTRLAESTEWRNALRKEPKQ